MCHFFYPFNGAGKLTVFVVNCVYSRRLAATEGWGKHNYRGF